MPDEPQPLPPPPTTHRTVAWLVCDPLPPVPLGPRPEVTIGRSTTCDLVLPHSAVSRVHAVVRVEAGVVLVEDRSSFGCFVNGERIAGPRALGASDKLTIGPYAISVAPVVPEGPAQALEATQQLVTPVIAQGTAMAGRFEKVTPIELLQGFEFHAKTAKVTFESPDAAGEVVVVDGRLARARLGDLTGHEAAVRFATLAAGLFSVTEPAADERAPALQASITEVLLEAFRRLDEGRRATGE